MPTLQPSSITDALFGTRSHTEVGKGECVFSAQLSCRATHRSAYRIMPQMPCIDRAAACLPCSCLAVSQGAQYQKPRKIPLRIEPKTYFGATAWVLGLVRTALPSGAKCLPASALPPTPARTAAFSHRP